MKHPFAAWIGLFCTEMPWQRPARLPRKSLLFADKDPVMHPESGDPAIRSQLLQQGRVCGLKKDAPAVERIVVVAVIVAKRAAPPRCAGRITTRHGKRR